MESIKTRVPWTLKIAAKVVLSRLPLPYRVWQRINLFKHGGMANAEYASTVFAAHFDPASFGRKGGGFTCLELGPGDSLLSAIIARQHGAVRTYLVDQGAYATDDVEMYRIAAQSLIGGATSVLSPEHWTSLEDVLNDCQASYLTDGLASLRTIPANSVDLIWSQAVLEHVRRAEFAPILAEFRRIIRDDGLSSHVIDLRDHLAGRLNNLRFRDSIWEHPLFAEAGFYTNRLRCSEIINISLRAGFSATSRDEVVWPDVPTPRSRMHASFRSFQDRDLCVRSFTLALAPIPRATSAPVAD